MVADCRRTTVLQSGFLPVTVARGSDIAQLRQQAGWGHCNLEIATSSTVTEFPVTDCRRTAVLQSGFLPVSMARESDDVQFRQQAGWGYCDLPVGASSTEVVIAAFRPFVYRRRLQRLRSRKRFLT